MTEILLRADDPPPVEIVNQDGKSALLLIGDHAGKLVPRRSARWASPRMIGHGISAATLG